MICWVQGLVENWPAVLEALATMALAVIAIFQWLAMRETNRTMVKQATLERERWQRDDGIRAQENEPKYRLGVVLERTGVSLWIVNLGTTSFLANTISISILNSATSQSSPGAQDWNEVVAKGEKKMFPIPQEWLPGGTGDTIDTIECRISVCLEGSTGQAQTPAKNFRVYRIDGQLSIGYSPD